MRGFNSTIDRKLKICKSCGKPSYIFSRGRCVDCARQEDNKDVVEDAGGESLSNLFDDLDTLFSLIVRMSAADHNGIARCYTCNDKHTWQSLQCGHYISRKCGYLRHDFRNARPQCNTCNVVKRGNLAEYGRRLEMEKPGITEILLEESRIVHKWSREELRGMVVEFNKQLVILKNKFKN